MFQLGVDFFFFNLQGREKGRPMNLIQFLKDDMLFPFSIFTFSSHTLGA